MDESYVQVGPDSSGKQIRNLKITERSVDTDGVETFSDRYVQVVAIADPVSGQVLSFDQSTTNELLREIRTELRILNFAYFQMAGVSQQLDPILARQMDEFTR